MIELQVLTADDWTVWRELRLAALTDAPSAFGSRLADWQGEGDREERWRGRLSIPGSHHLVAVLDGKPVGMISGVPGPHSGVVELISMWVSKDARGQGVGDHLLRAVERWARQTRAAALHLAVMPGNAPAFALYRRNGFHDTGPVGEVLPDGRVEHVMVKALSEAA
ncbi:N-acetyltransferase [Streptomyces nigrescens]|uniref:N-acetyltransferase n=2 Tax=Streptomyces TaxID=1883 RepID=A0ABM7ZU11_STRNI|nr:GNAT family N-acetyltransferase [Streptomyces nigrescens]MEE4418041.1 GNAT family N-acetyltransferase [Streptomyces sp. DSM 41528]BDM69620.1 N-acetyltransferase [Streptomyces nigrescens]